MVELVEMRNRNLFPRADTETKPGDRNTCLSPSSMPLGQNVALTSTSGHSFRSTRY